MEVKPILKAYLILSSILLFSCKTQEAKDKQDDLFYNPKYHSERHYELIEIKDIYVDKKDNVFFAKNNQLLDGFYKMLEKVDSSCYLHFERDCSEDEDKFSCSRYGFIRISKGKLKGNIYKIKVANKKIAYDTLDNYTLVSKMKNNKLITLKYYFGQGDIMLYGCDND